MEKLIVFNEEIMAKNVYGAKELINDNYHEKDFDDNYMVVEIPVDKEADLLENKEAEEKMEEIEMYTLLGKTTEIYSEDLRKLDLWIMQNPSLFAIYQAKSLTRDVNYKA